MSSSSSSSNSSSSFGYDDLLFNWRVEKLCEKCTEEEKKAQQARNGNATLSTTPATAAAPIAATIPAPQPTNRSSTLPPNIHTLQELFRSFNASSAPSFSSSSANPNGNIIQQFCSKCGAVLPVTSSTSANNSSTISSLLSQLQGGQFDLGAQHFIPFGGFHSSGTGAGARDSATGNVAQLEQLMSLISAQEDVNVDQLLNSLLTNSEYNAAPTAKKFLDNLVRRPFERRDCVTIVIRKNGLKKDIAPTIAEFGKDLISSHQLPPNDSDSVPAPPLQQQQLRAPLVLASPLSGKSLQNSSSLSGCVALFSRGEITFVDKCRAAQKAGAVAVIVMQNDKNWPYVMQDSKKEGGDIQIPCLLIGMKDAELLMESVLADRDEEKKADEKDVELVSRYALTACPICQQDFEFGEIVVTLPCSHCFHYESCVKKWLEQRSTCPLCRIQLPTDPKPGEAERATAVHDRAALQKNMFG